MKKTRLIDNVQLLLSRCHTHKLILIRRSNLGAVNNSKGTGNHILKSQGQSKSTWSRYLYLHFSLSRNLHQQKQSVTTTILGFSFILRNLLGKKGKPFIRNTFALIHSVILSFDEWNSVVFVPPLRTGKVSFYHKFLSFKLECWLKMLGKTNRILLKRSFSNTQWWFHSFLATKPSWIITISEKALWSKSFTLKPFFDSVQPTKWLSMAETKKQLYSVFK